MSDRYEYRFVVTGIKHDDGRISFYQDAEALDDDVWDNEQNEWYRLGHVQDDVLGDFYDVENDLSRRLFDDTLP